MAYNVIMASEWTVVLVGQAKKAKKNLPVNVWKTFLMLAFELKQGPMKGKWPNFGPLWGQKGCYHCHLQKGRPTYVACWMSDKQERLIEVYYAGTHEKAPY